MDPLSTDLQSCYRKLNRYKYQLTEDFHIEIEVRPTMPIGTPYLSLSEAGQLIIKKGYAWDGPSGPTIDTSTFMRSSLVHDALYQLMRLALVDHADSREYADRLLRRMSIQDGMCRFRAWYVYTALRWFGRKNALPAEDEPPKIYCTPF
ncbi:MAG: hypothetical protein BMS9Abin05_0141 [Rhodothermia bacterium]|nr:MAG: hypothetical protein BMS9Abin05_0141 [Rhodothermia bacterium]